MHTTRAIGATATLCAVLAAAGCGGSSGGATSTSAPSSTHSTKAGIASGEPAPPGGTSSSSATKSSSTKAEPTAKSTAAGAPGVPEAARQHTKAGATAFVRYYEKLLNDTAIRPRIGVLEPLALKSCKSCTNHQNTVRELKEKNEHFSKKQIAVKSVRVAGDSAAATYVEVHGYEPHVDVLDANGNSVQSFPEVKDQGIKFELRWTGGGWRVATVKIVTS